MEPPTPFGDTLCVRVTANDHPPTRGGDRARPNTHEPRRGPGAPGRASDHPPKSKRHHSTTSNPPPRYSRARARPARPPPAGPVAAAAQHRSRWRRMARLTPTTDWPGWPHWAERRRVGGLQCGGLRLRAQRAIVIQHRRDVLGGHSQTFERDNVGSGQVETGLALADVTPDDVLADARLGELFNRRAPGDKLADVSAEAAASPEFWATPKSAASARNVTRANC